MSKWLFFSVLLIAAISNWLSLAFASTFVVLRLFASFVIGFRTEWSIQIVIFGFLIASTLYLTSWGPDYTAWVRRFVHSTPRKLLSITTSAIWVLIAASLLMKVGAPERFSSFFIAAAILMLCGHLPVLLFETTLLVPKYRDQAWSFLNGAFEAIDSAKQAQQT